jgi:hypothetical protein
MQWTKMIFRAWRSWFGSDRHPAPCRRPLWVESLESRWVPATITPTTFADGGLGSGSLRDAVLQFNGDTGTGDDIIQLLPGTYTLTIANSHGHENEGLEGDLDLSQTSHRWIIQGVGSSTIIDASQLQDRVFQIVNPGTQVLFQDMIIQGGLAQDDGSEGALPETTDALGGGILNNSGDVTLDHVVLANNVARGGYGSYLGGNGYSAQGGGLYSTGGSLHLAASTLTNNQAIGGLGGDGASAAGGLGGAAEGAGLYATGGALDISNSTLAYNLASGGNGGAGRNGGPGGSGGAGEGAGAYASGAMVTLTDDWLENNSAAGGLGGDGSGVSGSGGDASAGALYTDGGVSVSLNGDTVRFNAATGGGGSLSGLSHAGGIYAPQANFSLDAFTITNTRYNTAIINPNIEAAPSLLVVAGFPFRTAGMTGRFSATAYDSYGDIATSYRGTVAFTSSAAQASLPAAYTFTAANAGVHSFSAALQTAGTESITATDTTDSSITGTQSGIVISPTSPVAFSVAAPASITAGVPFTVTVVAWDAFSNIATNYNGTVSFASTDSAAILPGPYTFSADDQGVHTFTNGVSLTTAGTQSITATAPGVFPAGIVSWWPGDGNTNDVVGSNNGTLVGGATYGTGMVNQAFSFPSAGAYFQAPANGLPTGNSDRTMELWVYINAFVTTEAVFSAYGVFGVSNEAYYLGATSSNGAVFFTQWGLGISGPSLQTGTWYHVAVTNVGNSATLYLNGTPVASGTLPINTPTGASFYMGSVPSPYGATRQLNGVTDEATVYNRALSAAEIRAIYDAGAAGKHQTVIGSATIEVIPAAADHLLFLQQPTNTAAGQTISPAVMVAIVDQFGNVVTSDNTDAVTLAIDRNPGGGTLSGTRTVTVVNGIATFSGLSIDLAGDGYTLDATVGGSLPDIDSNSFSIT